MSNYDFIGEFIRGEKKFGAYCHLGFSEDKLYNYSTVICTIDRENKKARVNVKKYSVTTSRIQSMVRGALKQKGYEIEDYVGEPCSYWNYGYQGAGNVTIDDMRSRRYE